MKISLGELKELVRKELLKEEIWDFNHLQKALPPASILAKILEYSTGSTYPKRTLERRIGLLTKKEKLLADRLWTRMVKDAERIDEIIANRAERENDPWP